MADSFDLEAALRDRGVPPDVRGGVLARPCQGCGHRRDTHAGWMNLYECGGVILDAWEPRLCECLAYDVVRP